MCPVHHIETVARDHHVQLRLLSIFDIEIAPRTFAETATWGTLA
jgi:hypothetical protein